MAFSPFAMMDIFAVGEIVVGSEKNITEKYATKLLYRQLMTPTTFDANSRNWFITSNTKTVINSNLNHHKVSLLSCAR